MAKKEMMMAAVYEKTGVVTVKEIPTPKITKPDDVLISVEAISICGSDTRALLDPPEFIYSENIVIGHEACGIVEEVGEAVTELKVGDRVVIHPNIGCGTCIYCRTGQLNLCESFTHLGNNIDGLIAEYACLSEKLLYKISRELPAHIACLAEPLACVLNGTRQVRVHPGEYVVVLGAGAIGLIYMLLYKAAGAKVIVTDVSEKRRAFALELGADFALDARGDVEKEVMKITKTGADLVTDAVGFLMDQAVSLIKKGGDIVLFGINESVEVKMSQAPIVFKEAQIHGAYIAKGTFPAAIQILENKVIPIEKIVTHRFPIQEVNKGIELMQTGESVKTVIEITKS